MKKSEVKDFAASIWFDKRLYKCDIEGSIAHTKMLSKCKIIKSGEAKKIIKGLEEIEKEISGGKFKFAPSLEDIHMNIEKRLGEKIGEAGGKLHTARSRNDQVALDTKLYLKDELKEIIKLVKNLQKVILALAQKHIGVIMPGYTHLQHAQPLLFSHHLMAYFFMLQRDKERFSDCLKRTDALPLGAGALAGTSFPIDRDYLAKLLKFSRVTENSVDTVSDRDFLVEFLSASSLLMLHLSRLSEELVLWSSREFSFLKLGEEFCGGSSIMPQKKNPDIAELIRGKTGRVYGNLFSLLTVMKGLPLSYNKDMQEDKEPLFDTVDTVKNSLNVYTRLFSTITIDKKKMREAIKDDFSLATDLADYLVKKGIPFRQAHGIVKKVVTYCQAKKKNFSQLSLGEFRKFSKAFKKDLLPLLKVESSLKGRTSFGGTARKQVSAQIRRAKQKWLPFP